MRTLDLSAWSTQGLTYLLIAVFLGIVLLILVLLFYLRRTRPQPAAAGADEAAAEPPPPEIIVRRKAWAARMEVVVNGRAYRRMKDIENPADRRALLLAVGDLVTFAGAAAGQSIAPPRANGVEITENHPASTGKQYAPARELAEHALLAQMEQSNLSVPQEQGWLAALGRGIGGRRPYAAGSRAFVDEIEAIIQRRRGDRGLKQEIHLRPDGQGIVRVEVDGTLYDSPGDIPDLNVRELIRAAVGEWEAGF